MAIFQAPGRMSGRTYNFNIRGDIPSETERARITQYIAQQEDLFAKQYEAKIGKPLAAPEDDGSAIGRGWERGKASAYSQLGSAVEYAGSGVGLDSLRDIGAGMRQAGDTESMMESLRQPAQTDWRDVKGLGSFGTYLGEQLGQTAPITGGVIAGGAAAALAAPELAGAALIGGTLVGTPFAFGSNVQRQEAEVKAGKRSAVDPGAALVAAVGQATLDAVSDRIALVGSGLLKPAKNIFVRGAVGVGEGAAAEGLTEIGQQMLERKQAGLSLTDDAAIQEYLDVGIAGGLIGGTLRGPTSLFQSRAEEDTGETPTVTEEVPNPTKDNLLPAPDKSILYASPTGDISNFAPTPVSTPEAPFELTPDMLKSAGLPAGHPLYKQVENGLVDGPAAIDGLKRAYKNIKDPKVRQGIGDIINSIVAPTNAGISTVTPAPTAEAAPAAAAVDNTQKKVEEAAATVNATTTQADPALTAAAKKTLREVQKEANKAQEAADKAAVGEPATTPVAPVAPAEELTPTDTEVGPTGLRLIHGSPTADLNLDGINIVREGQKQAKKGRKYGGFYATSVADLSQAQGYADMAGATGTVYDVVVKPGTKILRKEGDVTRLSESDIAKWTAEGYGLVIGTDPRGRTEHVVIDKNAIGSVAPIAKVQDAQVDDNQAVGASAQDAGRSPENVGPVAAAAQPATGAPVADTGGLAAPASDLNGLGATEVAQPGALGGQPAISTQPAALETVLTRAATIDPNPTAIASSRTTATQTANPDYTLARDYEERKRAEVAADNENAQKALDIVWKSGLPAEYVDDFESWQPQEDELIRRPDLSTATDKDKVRDLVTPKSDKGVGTRSEKDAAKNYFSKYRRPVDALYHMAEDIVGKVPGKRTMPDADPAETAFYVGTGESNATQAKAWVSKNLSPEANAAFERMLTTINSPKSRGRVVTEQRTLEAQNELRAATEEQIATENADTQQVKKGTESAIQQAAAKARVSLGFVPPNLMARIQATTSALEQRLTSYAQSLLSNGNLWAALHGIAHSSSDPRLAKLAMRMRTLVKDTQVRMVDTLSSPDGRTMAAAYDPATDTILFNRGAPDSMTNVTVLHEVAHAITHKALNNPSLPITQQLTKLFEDAQKAIGTDTVGMDNIHEFVAEAFTNKMFRDMLQASYPNGGKFSAWARFKNAVANFIRRVFGAQPKPLGSVLDDLDMHLDQLLDTASDVTGPRPDPGQGLLYRASNDPQELTGAMARMFREEQKFGMPNKSFRDNWANRAMELYTNSKGLLSKGVLGFSSLLQLADTANAAKITDAYDLYDAVTRLEASTIASDSEVQAALVRMQEWAKKFPEKRSLLNKIVAFSTINQVDPEKNTSVYEQYWLKYDPTGEYKDGVKYEGYKTAAERDARLKALRDKYGKDKAKSGANANPSKAKLHAAMQESWNALGPEGRAIYNLMRMTYRKQFMAMRDAVGGKIDFALGENSTLAKSIKSNIYERFFDFRSLEPYFPLVRKGQYWMSYTVMDPVTGQEEEVKETFETRAERDRVRSLLKAEVPSVRMGANGQPEVRMYEDSGLKRKRIGAPETNFVRDVLSSLVANKVSDKAQSEIADLFIDALPETSFARAIKGRSGVRGFEADALEAFRLKAFTLGRQAARYPFMQKVQEIRDKIAAQGIDATTTLYWLKYDPTGKFTGQEKFESFKTAKEMDVALKALRKKYGANNAKSSGMTTESAGPVHMELIKELVNRADTAMRPPQGAWQEVAKAANQFAFTYTLGLNISSALVNLSAVPIVMVPYLSGKYGLANTTRTTRAAYKLFLNSGFNTNLTTATGDVVNVKATPSIDNYFELKDVNGKMKYVLRTDLNLSEAQKKQMQDMLPLVELAAAQGLLSRSLTYDTLGVENFGQNKTMLDKLSMLQGLPFHMVERSNRQVSLMASYQMELERLRKNPTEAEKSLTDAQKQEQAAEKAAYMTAEMHGTHTLSTAPRYAQSGLGRIAMMFKSYGLNIAYMQFKMLKQGCENLFPGKDAEARALRNTAFKQLLGLQLSTALIAGVSGVPLYGLYRMVANMFLGDDDEDADMLTRKALGEWAFRGPLTEALGIDISSRTGLNDLLFRANPYANTQSNADFIAALIGGPAWSTGNQFLSGLTEMKKAAMGQGGDFQRGLENMLPPLPKNILKDIRFATEGARTRRGDAVLNELSPSQLMWQITGFKPAELAHREEITRGAARMDKAVAQEKTTLLNRYNLAKSQGDRNEMAAVQQDIQEYNAKVRAKYPKMQITSDTIKSSGTSFERVTARTHNGVTFNPATESYFTTLLSAHGAE